MSADSDAQLHVGARPLLAQVHHALQLVVRAEAPAALGGVVEGGRLRCQQTTSALACSRMLTHVLQLPLPTEALVEYFGTLLLWHVSLRCKLAHMPLDRKDSSVTRD